jgi:hypothetical protein
MDKRQGLFVKNWKVVWAKSKDPGRSVGMPEGQRFLIRRVTEPQREYFQIVPTHGTDLLALDWAQAELEPAGEDGLKYFFADAGTRWHLAITAGGALLAIGKADGSSDHAEAAGEWEANEEGGG